MKKQKTIGVMCCPFCGSVPEMEPWHGGGPNKRRIGCINDRCHVGPGVTGETPATAARRWNARAGNQTLFNVDVTPA